MRVNSGTFWTYAVQVARTEWRTSVFWTIGLSIYAGLVVAIYPSVKDAANLDALPENMRTAFNITDFTYLAGFLSSQLFGVILPLIVPFYAIVMLSNVVAGAEERGRLDILLGNPIPRWNLVVGSFLVVLVYLLVMVLVFGCVIRVIAGLLDLDLTLRQAVRATFVLWPTAMVFGGFALLLSTIVRQRATAIGIPAAIVLLSYLALVIGRLAEPVSFIQYASAYHYYGAAIIEGVWWGGMGLLGAVTVAMLIGAIVQFNRRDVFA
jgi:ABC-2 type transport system permease protein